MNVNLRKIIVDENTRNKIDDKHLTDIKIKMLL